MLRVCELFSETIRNMFGWGCYFVVECYGGCLMWLEVLIRIDNIWSSTERMCCACDLVCVKMILPYVLLVFLFVCQKLSPHLSV